MSLEQALAANTEGTDTELGQQGATESSPTKNVTRNRAAAVHSGSWSLFTGCGMTCVYNIAHELRGMKATSV